MPYIQQIARANWSLLILKIYFWVTQFGLHPADNHLFVAGELQVLPRILTSNRNKATPRLKMAQNGTIFTGGG